MTTTTTTTTPATSTDPTQPAPRRFNPGFHGQYLNATQYANFEAWLKVQLPGHYAPPLTPEDVVPTDFRGEWKPRIPCMGTCKQSVRGPYRHSLRYSDPRRALPTSPYDTWTAARKGYLRAVAAAKLPHVAIFTSPSRAGFWHWPAYSAVDDWMGKRLLQLTQDEGEAVVVIGHSFAGDTHHLQRFVEAVPGLHVRHLTPHWPAYSSGSEAEAATIAEAVRLTTSGVWLFVRGEADDPEPPAIAYSVRTALASVTAAHHPIEAYAVSTDRVHGGVTPLPRVLLPPLNGGGSVPSAVV